MLAEGREAGLVGELADATPAELLGTVAEHYTRSSASGRDRHLAGRPRRLAGPAGAGGPRLPVPFPPRGAAEDPRRQRVN